MLFVVVSHPHCAAAANLPRAAALVMSDGEDEPLGTRLLPTLLLAVLTAILFQSIDQAFTPLGAQDPTLAPLERGAQLLGAILGWLTLPR